MKVVRCLQPSMKSMGVSVCLSPHWRPRRYLRRKDFKTVTWLRVSNLYIVAVCIEPSFRLDSYHQVVFCKWPSWRLWGQRIANCNPCRAHPTAELIEILAVFAAKRSQASGGTLENSWISIVYDCVTYMNERICWEMILLMEGILHHLGSIKPCK